MYVAKEGGRNRVESISHGGPAWEQASLLMI
jgi:hypothetical protein